MKAIDTARLTGLLEEHQKAKQVMSQMRGRFDRLSGRHENGTAPKAFSAYQLFQTPKALAARMADMLDIQPTDHVLEPSAGLGRLIDAVQAVAPCNLTAIEIDPAIAEELRRIYRNIVVRCCDFLDCVNQSGFDKVIMNPPFHLRDDLRHILAALKMTKPGGRLVAICMNTDKRTEQLKHLTSHWEELPTDTFKESGTNVGTVLLTIDQPTP